MNNIVFAGKLNDASAVRNGARFTVIVPSEADKGGKIFWEDKGCQYEIDFPSSAVIIVPPSVNFRLSLKLPDECICLVMERCPLPFKEITVVFDDKNHGILHAAQQADEYLNGISSFKKKTELILSSLGGLLVSYLISLKEEESFSSVIKQILADIDKNVSNTTFFLEDYIKTLPLNYDYVRKLFKKEVGATPHEYLLNKRMELAAHFLESDLSNRYSPFPYRK